MSILYRSNKRFQDTNEAVSYEALDALAMGTAEVEPETVRNANLVQDDIVQILAGLDVAFTGALVKVGATTLTAGTSVLLSDTAPAPETATADSVVTIDQRMNHIYLTGCIELIASGSNIIPRVRFVAHNIGNASETITVGQVIGYAVHDGAVTEQPLSPNAQLMVTPGHRWLTQQGVPTFEPVTITALNQTALPIIEIQDKAITELELNGVDIAKLAALYTGNRKKFTVATDTPVPIGPAVLLGTVVFDPSISVKVVKVGALGVTPLFTGFVSSTNGTTTVSLYARNNAFSTVTVRAFTVLNIIAY